jgi:hypothetical protein
MLYSHNDSVDKQREYAQWILQADTFGSPVTMNAQDISMQNIYGVQQGTRNKDRTGARSHPPDDSAIVWRRLLLKSGLDLHLGRQPADVWNR